MVAFSTVSDDTIAGDIREKLFGSLSSLAAASCSPLRIDGPCIGFTDHATEPLNPCRMTPMPGMSIFVAEFCG